MRLGTFAEEFGIKDYGWVKPENLNASLEKEVYDHFKDNIHRSLLNI